MRLYFMRHGQAAWQQGEDCKRPLTEQGRLDVARVIGSRKAELNDLGLILTSPYRRARQTAEIARQCLGFDGDTVLCDELVPDSNFVVLARLLNDLDANSILLTSHQPLTGNVLATLTGDSHLQAIDPAWLVALETEAATPGFANLKWLQTPD